MYACMYVRVYVCMYRMVGLNYVTPKHPYLGLWNKVLQLPWQLFLPSGLNSLIEIQ
jgi:hypothetical protein